MGPLLYHSAPVDLLRGTTVVTTVIALITPISTKPVIPLDMVPYQSPKSLDREQQFSPHAVQSINNNVTLLRVTNQLPY